MTIDLVISVDKIIDQVDGLAGKEQWGVLSCTLHRLPLRSMAMPEIIAYARCCWPYRDRLPYYDEYIMRIRRVLNQRDEDPQKWLGWMYADEAVQT